jgi:hypothetical protein
MKTKHPQQKATLLNKIKVRLDYKTVIVLKNISLFAKWKRLYPEAKIID